MADAKGPIALERLRLELNVAELELSLRRIAVQRAEKHEELARLDVSEQATHRGIAEVREKLRALVEPAPVSKE